MVIGIPAPRFMEALLEEPIDLDTQPVKVMLTDATYVFDPATHVFITAVSGEVTGTEYTAGGATVPNSTVGTTSGIVSLDGDDVVWPASTITARKCVFYVDTGTPATSPILGVWDFEEDKSTSGTDFRITLNAAGLVTFQT